MALENVVVALFTVLSGILLLISVLALVKNRSWRMGILSGVFVLFLAKGAFLTLALFTDIVSAYWVVVLGTGIDSLALVTLFVAALKV